MFSEARPLLLHFFYRCSAIHLVSNVAFPGESGLFICWKFPVAQILAINNKIINKDYRAKIRQTASLIRISADYNVKLSNHTFINILL